MKRGASKTVIYLTVVVGFLLLFAVVYGRYQEIKGIEQSLFFMNPSDIFHYGLFFLGIIYLLQKSLADYTLFQVKDQTGNKIFIVIIISSLIFALGIIGIWFVDLARSLERTNWNVKYGAVTQQFIILSTKEVFNIGITFQALSILLQTGIYFTFRRLIRN